VRRVENNNILRRLRYTFDLNDTAVMALFSTEAEQVTREQVCAWLKNDEDPDFVKLDDASMARFLDAFIVLRRGPRDGPPRPTELRLTNNIVLRKLKIALNLHEADMLRLMEVGGLPISKPELSALFRRAGHKHQRHCQDQFLRKFLVGVQREMGPDVKD
jgi:uncharacterized protein YehS (DUF1456 family)